MGLNGAEDRPLVSVILTTRDRPRFLRIALACYRRQTYPNRELIVVDDGDRFPAGAADVEAEGGRLIRVPAGTLLGTKLNHGVAAARGPLCQKMDDDDWYSPIFLETMVRALAEDQSEICRPSLAFVTPFLFFEVAPWEIRRSPDGNAPGATLMFAREDWEHRPFRNLPQDEDVWFHRDHTAAGLHTVLVKSLEIFLAVRHRGSGQDRTHTWTHQYDGRTLEEHLQKRPLYRCPEDLLPDWALSAYRKLRQEIVTHAPATRALTILESREVETPQVATEEEPLVLLAKACIAPQPIGAAAISAVGATAHASGLPQQASGLHEKIGRGPALPSVLMVQNIHDGQGDEIIRTVPLLQALLDSNPKLHVTLLTNRAYLYGHPRIRALPFADRPKPGNFDAVIDFFEGNIQELNYDVELETEIQAHVRAHPPKLYVAADKGFNHFTYHTVELDGRPCARKLGVDRQRVNNVYETTFRLLAALGLPLRTGQEAPVSEPVLAGVEWPAAESEWRRLTQSNTEQRPVALLNPFGGGDPLKGYVASQMGALAARIQRLIGDGYFVVLAPNGTAWGTEAQARAAIARLDADSRRCVSVAPDAGAAPDQAGADSSTRQLIYFVRFASLIVAVEGWMIHAAYCLGKSYRILMMPYSHPPEWHPWAQSADQRIDWPAEPCFSDDGDPLNGFVLEQPRKSAMLALLPELGAAGGLAALPFLERAVKAPDRDIRAAAAEGLSRLGAAVPEPLLRGLLADSWHGVRAAAARALLARHQSAPREPLQAHVLIGAPQRDWARIVALGHRARPALEIAARDEDPVVRREAAWALKL